MTELTKLTLYFIFGVILPWVVVSYLIFYVALKIQARIFKWNLVSTKKINSPFYKYTNYVALLNEFYYLAFFSAIVGLIEWFEILYWIGKLLGYTR